MIRLLTKKNKEEFYEEYAVAIEGIVRSDNNSTFNLYFLIKRLIDIVVSLIGIIVTAPILIVVAIVIKIDSRGSVLFFQERLGHYGKPFKVIKLRSMIIDAERNGAKWAERNDPRITRVGAFIRKTRIDEIPQLINVLMGDMSLIGPRPELPVFTAKFNEEIPGFVRRLVVKPGLTGWAQVNGGYELSPKNKLELDMYYIKNQSLIIDLKIILKTVRVVFTGEGAR